MGQYSHIIDGMTWSFSRIETFHNCRYEWASLYIYGEEKRRLFFSDFGSFMHDMIRRFLSGEIEHRDLPDKYISEFSENVSANAPSFQIISSRFEDGFSYLRSPMSGLVDLKSRDILRLEQSFDGYIDGIPFTGIVDMVSIDGDEMVITDHKSSVIKPPSGRKKATKYDTERNEKARQLYLYSVMAEEQLGRWPDRLEFNCFRVPEIVSIPFDAKAKDETIRWVHSAVDEISDCDRFDPNIDFFYCKYLCHLSECPYRDLI